jgi:hypothetical protein
MKTQQGFSVLAGAKYLLIGALVVGGTAIADDTSSISPSQQQAYEGTLYRNGGHYGSANSDISLENPVSSAVANVGAVAVSTLANMAATLQQAYTGTLYRNGGYFGDQNSDVKLEKDSR